MIGSNGGAKGGPGLTGLLCRVARGSVVRMVAVCALMLPLAACATPPTTSEMFAEYLRSTDVVGDEFESGSAETRMAVFASIGSPEEVIGRLMAPRPCSTTGCARPWKEGGANKPLPGLDAAHAIAGSNGRVYERKVLVKRDDDELELISLYLVHKADGTKVLVDSNKEAHAGGLDGFRETNDVLEYDDFMLVTREITALTGRSEIVVVSGHTPPSRKPWLIGSGIALATVIALVMIIRRLRRT
ncbi:hypothetical protein BZB76_0653 [Actinomadura pelletieri DSM 43383]|uniref:Lipoprotein n=1 Tax=Actinomadura pelletieri DSM 43383 TaxID=1120940 RepID=A0A495QYD3_9ACTN|nr:hypothetical protein [Actinomadura pelletieri]RKS79205.1 hypothetical protein BZB76_0653 [Actinomadura pelletieri DSM 43383]